ncbi:hypothetical protein C0J52_01082 [Blattella germanica]|nr:hypothetical protein C0J52_01082 [Blattella germanica]
MEHNKDDSYDVILEVSGKCFPCQRRILAEHSPYFQAMFSNNFIERNKSSIEIQGVDPDAMAILLQSLYTKEVDILKSEDILSVLQASSMLLFETIQKSCIDLIVHDWLNISTCLQTMITAYELGLASLHHKAKALALWEFSQVKNTGPFMELNVDQLVKYISSDGLNVTDGEFEVLEGALNWLQHQPLHRKEYIKQILECIRFSEVSASDIRTILLYPIFKENLDCFQILKYIICIKEGKYVNDRTSDFETHSSTNLVKDDENDKHTGSKQKKSKICVCPHMQVNEERCSILNNCSNCCTDIQEPIIASVEQESHIAENNEYVSFKAEIISAGRRLLGMPCRSLPLVPCVVGHKIEGTGLQQMEIGQDRRQQSVTDRGKAYIIYFQEKESKSPLPFLQITKPSVGPQELKGYKVICKGLNLYIIGGEHLVGYGNWNLSVWKYDIIRETWHYETSIPSPRRHQSVCCLGDYIYIIGGVGRHRVIMDSVEKYHVGTRIWSRCSALPQSLYSAACCTHKGSIFVFGPQVYLYNSNFDNWHVLSGASMLSTMSFSTAMSHGDWIYLTGTYSKELVRFTPQNITVDEDIASSNFDVLGSFKHLTSNTCLVHNVIYSFSSDDFENNMYVEAYYIAEKKFEVLWDSITMGKSGILDFSPKHCIGCFPLLRY